MDVRANIPSKLIDVCPRKKWDWSGPGGAADCFKVVFFHNRFVTASQNIDFSLKAIVKICDISVVMLLRRTHSSTQIFFPIDFDSLIGSMVTTLTKHARLNTFQPIFLPTWIFISNTKKYMDTAMFGQYIYCSAAWEKVVHNFEKYNWFFYRTRVWSLAMLVTHWLTD